MCGKICILPSGVSVVSLDFNSIISTILTDICVKNNRNRLESPCVKCQIMCGLPRVFPIINLGWTSLRSSILEYNYVKNSSIIFEPYHVKCGRVCGWPNMISMFSRTVLLPPHHIYQGSYLLNWRPGSVTMVPTTVILITLTFWLIHVLPQYCFQRYCSRSNGKLF